jgi:hypothetical protein
MMMMMPAGGGAGGVGMNNHLMLQQQDQQQAEIEALRAQLEQQRLAGAPVSQIEVHQNDIDLVHDDLTIFTNDNFSLAPHHSTAKRPDASASVVSKPASPKSTTRAFPMTLSDGQVASAVFTGNLTHDMEGDYAGVGVIRLSNGTAYRGEMRHSAFHGHGALVRTVDDNIIMAGRFEYGRYMGPS